MARLTGLEPATPGVTGRYSNQPSHTRAQRKGQPDLVALKRAECPIGPDLGTGFAQPGQQYPGKGPQTPDRQITAHRAPVLIGQVRQTLGRVQHLCRLFDHGAPALGQRLAMGVAAHHQRQAKFRPQLRNRG